LYPDLISKESRNFKMLEYKTDKKVKKSFFIKIMIKAV
jgi:hypothetical protein